jgi:hypothetical protein
MKGVHDEASFAVIDGIYRQLKKGLGRELVDDGNVFALIELANRDGEQVLEQELREWQSLCGSGMPSGPTLSAPTPGFNKLNVKH